MVLLRGCAVSLRVPWQLVHGPSPTSVGFFLHGPYPHMDDSLGEAGALRCQAFVPHSCEVRNETPDLRMHVDTGLFSDLGTRRWMPQGLAAGPVLPYGSQGGHGALPLSGLPYIHYGTAHCAFYNGLSRSFSKVKRLALVFQGFANTFALNLLPHKRKQLSILKYCKQVFTFPFL